MGNIKIIKGVFDTKLELEHAGIKAGFPSPADDYRHETLDFNRDYIRHPEASFYGDVACWLGLVPTVLSLVFMTIAVHEVGATPTAIMGALEPLTAVAIGVMVFDESLTFRLAVGIVLILSAVLLIVMGKSFHLRTITHTITTLVRKTWRWKS